MYAHVVLGGTFDHFHAGHESLIAMALSLGGKVTIGLTAQDFIHIKQFPETIKPYEEREKEVIAFAKKRGRETDIRIIKIHDVFGTTLTDTTLQAIVVTEHTRAGADHINRERRKRGMPELTVHVCPFVHDDSGEILSSTRVRAGVVNRRGFVHTSLFKEDIEIDEKLAKILREPLGTVFPSLPPLEKNVSPRILIGDIVTQSVIAANEAFTCAYIDHASHRKPYAFTISLPYRLVATDVQNPHGHITHASAVHITKHGLAATNTVFSITGEEDLLALPAILLSPLESRVLYGQPFGKEGVVVVTVTEEKKNEVISCLFSGRIHVLSLRSRCPVV